MLFLAHHVGIRRPCIKYWNVGRILVHNGPNGIVQLFANEPAMIGSEFLDKGTIPIHQILKVKLILEGSRGL
jgi:hypothetical protein